MTLNLVQHRSGPSIWEDNSGTGYDTERWLIAMVAGAFLVSGLRRRTPLGLLQVVGGGALAWWAAARTEDRRIGINRLRARLQRPKADGDGVNEASEESFPASDAPSWTPTTGPVPSDRAY